MKTTGVQAASIDPNHTHFIFVDDNQKGVYGGEIGFRTAFEQHNTKHNHGVSTAIPVGEPSSRGSISVPVVLLMLEGGKNTMRTAYEAIEKRTPIVIFAGSGRAADTIAVAHRHT